jgi:hypothetical protein
MPIAAENDAFSEQRTVIRRTVKMKLGVRKAVSASISPVKVSLKHDL